MGCSPLGVHDKLNYRGLEILYRSRIAQAFIFSMYESALHMIEVSEKLKHEIEPLFHNNMRWATGMYGRNLINGVQAA